MYLVNKRKKLSPGRRSRNYLVNQSSQCPEWCYPHRLHEGWTFFNSFPSVGDLFYVELVHLYREILITRD